MKYQLDIPNQQTSLTQIEDLGFDLPPAYRDFLLETNGGECDLEFHKENMILEISVFYGVIDSKTNGLSDNFLIYSKRFNRRDRLPIGHTAGGDVLCIDLSDESIVIWWHESEDFERISSSFQSFWEQLKSGEYHSSSIHCLNACENASRDNNISEVSRIINSNGDVGESMRIAAMNGHFEIVDLLIEHNHDINLVCSDGRTPTDWASWNDNRLVKMRKRGGRLSSEL